MDFFKNTKIDFLKYKIPAMFLSLIIVVAGLIVIWQRGLKYGVDFSGGTAIQVKFRNPVALESVRKTLKEAGFPDSGVQGFNDPTQILVRLPQKVSSEDQIEALSKRVSEILVTKVVNQSIPTGKEDLNSATQSQIANYLELVDPWGTKTPGQYAGEAAKLYKMKADGTGLMPDFDQIKGVDPKVIAALKERYYVSNVAILSVEYVGPQVGAELREQAELAVLWSLAGLLIYVWFRFQLLWGFAAIVCLAHDVLITLAFFAFAGREISLTVVAAFLTIVGYSLNDTIVIYDRVRDNLKTMRTQTIESVINLTLNQMLGRTILTNGTVFAVVLVLYFFGGEVINDFAFAMLVGCISGAYSTIYIASALIVLYQEHFGKKKPVPVKTKEAKAQKVSG
jgi:preprotein translocase subunit SecF